MNAGHSWTLSCLIRVYWLKSFQEASLKVQLLFHLFRQTDHSGSNSPVDDEELIADLLEDKQIILERLDRLKSRGITINQTKELQKSATIEQTCPSEETFSTEEFLKHLEDEAPTNDENESIEIVSITNYVISVTFNLNFI
jgi:hypothetical protein